MIDSRKGRKIEKRAERARVDMEGISWLSLNKGSCACICNSLRCPFSLSLPFFLLPPLPLPPFCSPPSPPFLLPSLSPPLLSPSLHSLPPLFLLPSLSFLPPSPSFLSPFRPSLLPSQVLRNVQLESALLRAELTLHQREEAFRAVEGRNQRLQRDVAQSHLASSRAVKQFERRTTEGTFTSGQTSVYCYFILSLNLANQRNENFANPIMLQAIILK